MREIKFRAWHKKLGMITPAALRTNGGTVTAIDNDGFGKHYGLDAGVALMQYTGLKDKNGVEIYEGDILDGYCSQGRVRLGALEWQQTKLRFYAPPRRAMNDADLFERMSSYEVIGNIWENPELLEANQ